MARSRRPPPNDSAAPPSPEDGRRALLAEQLARLPAARGLRDETRDELARWLAREGPFAEAADLHQQLAAAKLRGVKREQRREIADALLGRFGRRSLLAGAAGVAGAVAIGLGVGSDESAAPIDIPSLPGDGEVRAVIAALQQQRATAGETMRALAADPANGAVDLGATDPSWRRVCHALDTSNWLEAAVLLAAVPATALPNAASRPGPVRIMVRALRELHAAWRQVLAVRAQWEHDYFVAYALGRMPALAPGAAEQQPFAGNEDATARSLAALRQLAPLCHALDVTNQRFQQPGRTAEGASIRFTQGHNFSYAHFTAELADGNVFAGDGRRVLVNWDAHADLSPPLENPRTSAAFSLSQLLATASHGERVAAASTMSIAGWMLPLVFQQHLGPATGDQPAEILWIVPREAAATSKNCVPPYGSYRATVGAWRLPDDRAAIAAASTLPIGPWNLPGAVELRSFSDEPTLRSVNDVGVLADPREYVVHIVQPEDAEGIAQVVEGAALALSVDVDFAGTREPSTLPRRGYLPHYPLTGSPAERERHGELIGLLSEFYATHRQRIRCVSIANSPTFTVEEGERMPAARMLEIFATDVAGEQPDWVRAEIAREPAPPATNDSTANWSKLAWLGGGAASVLAAAGILADDLRRRGQIRAALLAGDGPTPPRK
ncbi:MAG: hypothetical protein CMJ58_08650 [Planctomycetaceae bacterium]|nr:hypothetical protein [Planctomycetaceae bacterium]